jgi:hypothetical protein
MPWAIGVDRGNCREYEESEQSIIIRLGYETENTEAQKE